MARIRLLSLGSCALALLTAAAVLGCPRTDDRVQPRTTLPPQPAVGVAPPPPPPPAPLPSEADLVIEAARSAEAQGDLRNAIEQYRKASGLILEGERQAEIHFKLAVLLADPNYPERSIEGSRAELQRVLTMVTDHPRLREARVLATLLDESAQLKKESADLKTEMEALKGQVAELKTKLDEKEKELAGIKKLLLQNKGKP